MHIQGNKTCLEDWKTSDRVAYSYSFPNEIYKI